MGAQSSDRILNSSSFSLEGALNQNRNCEGKGKIQWLCWFGFSVVLDTSVLGYNPMQLHFMWVHILDFCY